MSVSDFVTSGRPRLPPERPTGMSRGVVTLASGKQVLRSFKASGRSRVAGGVNHGTEPISRWWRDGFGRRDPSGWEECRIYDGTSGRTRLIPSPQERRRESMLMAWHDHLDDLAIAAGDEGRAAPGRFHRRAVLRLLLSRRHLTASNRRPWMGPVFHRGLAKQA